MSGPLPDDAFDSGPTDATLGDGVLDPQRAFLMFPDAIASLRPIGAKGMFALSHGRGDASVLSFRRDGCDSDSVWNGAEWVDRD